MSATSRGSRARARQTAAAKAAEAANKSDQTDTPPTEAMDLDLPDPSMQLLAEAAQNQARAPEHNEIKDEEDDSRSSSLSDIDDRGATEGSEQPDNESAASEDEDAEDDDTEAETERLEPSPDKPRKQKKVLLNSVLEDNASSVAAQDDDGDQGDELEEKAEEDPTEQAEEGEESGESSAEDSERESAAPRSKKRKRAEDDETAKALKKVSLGLANHVAEQSKATEDDETPEPTAADTALDEDDASRDESPAEEETGPNAAAEVEEPVESNVEDAEDADAAQEADASSTARTEEEMRNKKAALEKLSDIEKDFALLRDKLFADRNAQLAEELATIQSDTPTHPEYLAMIDAIEQLRNERIEHAKTVFRYKLQALEKKATTTRAAAQSQYMQRVRELRDESLERASAEWYQIQRERRNFDADREPALGHFVGDRSQWVTAQTAYNTEVSVLSGVAKFVGFPAAPEIGGATAAEVEEDMKNMGISRNPVQAPATAPISQLGRAKPAAEEQFIAETAWANPQHQQSQYLTNVHRQQISNNLRPGSPLNTPAAQRQNTDLAPNGSASTIPALPSSSLAPTPMSAEPNAVFASVSKIALGYGSLDTPSKAPERGDPKQVSGLVGDSVGESQDSSPGTQTLANENGTGATPAGANSTSKPSPPAQAAPALKDTISGKLEGQSSLPPGVEVGGG